ncbi:MAG TPA: hypothetical protein K8W01_04055 [Methylorubrum populi]|uniref:Uncharacterized protein n=1 Tax=Methylorubrum populi TaxID=223967 RepID=A0A921DZW0_9HYPH|nr:hypothetical protein [Methylorubrum populi]
MTIVFFPPDCDAGGPRKAEADAEWPQGPVSAAALEPGLNSLMRWKQSSWPQPRASEGCWTRRRNIVKISLTHTGSRRPVLRQDPAMISLSDSLLTAASLLGLGAAAVPGRTATDAPAFGPFAPQELLFIGTEKNLSPDEAETDDPFFIAIADALREAGYLDS